VAILSLVYIEAQIKEQEIQITRLRAAATKQRPEEIGAVVKDVRATIAEHGMSANELLDFAA
jgi:hypothetical protein